MNNMRFRGTAALVASAALVACTAAAAGPAQDPGKGGGSPPVTLTFANSDRDLLGVPAVQRFLDRVKQLSGGAVKISVRNAWGGGSPRYELGVLRDVRRGEVDMAWLGTRVFDKAGVTSFQALEAPMLVDSYALQKAVLRGPLPGRMLAGLKQIDLVGLALLGDKLRRPFGTKRFLAKPADYAGIAFRTYASEVQERAIRALGGRPVNLGWAGLRDALEKGRLQGMETDLLLYNRAGYTALAPFAAPNVVLWPRVLALVINEKARAKLSAQQRDWLQRAAGDGAAYSLTLLQSDRRNLVDACNGGARVAVASHGDLAALRRAWAPLYRRIEQNAETKSFVRSIEALKRSTPGDLLGVPAACRKVGGAAPTEKGAIPTKAKFTEGVYRYELNRADILDTLPTASEHWIANYLGVFTWRFKGGKVTMHQRAVNAPDTYWNGKYTIRGNFFTVRWIKCEGCPAVEKVRWRWNGRTLRFHKASNAPGDILTWNLKKPWVKIG